MDSLSRSPSTTSSSLGHLSVHGVEHGDEHQSSSQGRGQQHGVAEVHRGYHHRQDLPRDHDNVEHHGPELADGVIDEQLSCGAGDGRDDVVYQRDGVVVQEVDHHRDLAAHYQGHRGDADGRQVHPEHHVELIHLHSIQCYSHRYTRG